MATIDDLLRRMHRQAAGLRLAEPPDRQRQQHLAAWTTLAATSRRVLESLDPRPGEHPDFYATLNSLTRHRRASAGEPDPDLHALAMTVGALGDILDTFPKDVAAAGQAQRSRLQASIQAALHAAARTTCDLVPGNGYLGMLVGKVAEATELAALLPPRARVSSLEGLTVTRLTPDTVDGAAQLWLGAAERTFTNYQFLTGIALQEAAATLSLLSQITAATLREAARRRILDPSSAREAAALMDRAAAAWRTASTWPTSVQLGGRAPEHHRAARAVREALTGPPLTRLTLREKVSALRSAATAAATIGRFQAGAVTWTVDSGGLWIGHIRPNLRPPGVQRHQIKTDWESMPPDHPAGILLASRAHAAWRGQLAATEAMDQAVRPSIIRNAGDIALVGNRIAAAPWETIRAGTHVTRHQVAAPLGPSRQPPTIPR